MGFKRAFIPKKGSDKYQLPKDFIVVGVTNIEEVVNKAFA